MEIGRNSVISYGARIMTRTDTPHGKRMNDASPLSQRRIREGNVKIGSNCFIGAHAVIMPGVQVGDRAVIGVGTYVDHDVPRNTILPPKQNLLQRTRKTLKSL